MNEPGTSSPLVHGVKVAAGIVAFVALLWIIEGVNAVTGDSLIHLGIIPRTMGGLEGVVFAPFLHGSFGHIAANTLPLLILGFLAAVRGTQRFLVASVIIILVSGLGVWLTAASGSVTVGASGLILGYFGYLLARGLFDHSLVDIAIAVAVAVFYGTLIFAVLPGASGISWQAHLFGLIGGVIAAWVQRRPRLRAAPPRPSLGI
ncbi:MAG TPA: rhomboid family intramembrane serine protease [Streptosporangiaceae bacterium]|jgi:membrane associated rhomboid family serine protease